MNLVEMHDSDITSGIITLKDGRNETQEQGHGRGDFDWREIVNQKSDYNRRKKAQKF